MNNSILTLTYAPQMIFIRDKVALIRRYTGGGTVVVDENTGEKRAKMGQFRG